MILMVVSFISCKSNSQQVETPQQELTVATENVKDEVKETFFLNSAGEKIDKINRSEDEWSSQLTKIEYYVLREKGTERAFTGDLLRNKKKRASGHATSLHPCDA